MFSHISGMESLKRQSLWFSFAAVLSILRELFSARRDAYNEARFEFNDDLQLLKELPLWTQETSMSDSDVVFKPLFREGKFT